jgi:hypothetical protein
MAYMMIKLAMTNFCEIILEKSKYFFPKNHWEIQVQTILVCTLYSIKYGNCQIVLYAECHYAECRGV